MEEGKKLPAPSGLAGRIEIERIPPGGTFVPDVWDYLEIPQHDDKPEQSDASAEDSNNVRTGKKLSKPH